jgi:acetyltransferase-like isoleucine patch superfamily enzyme
MRLRSKALACVELSRSALHGHFGSRIGSATSINIEHGLLDLAKGARIQEGTHIAIVGTSAERAVLSIGTGTSLGARGTINVAKSVTIGSHTEISWQCQILDTDFHQIVESDRSAKPFCAPVIIGNHVLIGTASIITKGVRIGDGAVIGAGSVVTRDVPAGTLAAGNPARVIRQIANWS